MRSCVVTGEKLEKRELLRIVRTPEKEVIVDLSGKANGRGAYLKKDIETFEKAEKSKILIPASFTCSKVFISNL